MHYVMTGNINPLYLFFEVVLSRSHGITPQFFVLEDYKECLFYAKYPLGTKLLKCFNISRSIIHLYNVGILKHKNTLSNELSHD